MWENNIFFNKRGGGDRTKQSIWFSQLCSTRSWTPGLVKPCWLVPEPPFPAGQWSVRRSHLTPPCGLWWDLRQWQRQKMPSEHLKAKWTDVGFQISAWAVCFRHLLVTSEKSKVGQVPISSSRQKAGFDAHWGRSFYVCLVEDEVLVVDAEVWSQL